MRRRFRGRALGGAATLALVVTALTACDSSSTTDNDTAADYSAPATMATTSTAPITSAAPVITAADATTYSFTYSGQGTSLTGTMQLSPPMRANDPNLAGMWSGIVRGAPSSVSCVQNDNDAVVVGSITFDVSAYNGGDVLFSIQKPQVGNSLDIEAHYSNEPVAYCDGPQSFPFEPTIQGSQWGPVPIAFTIPKAYGFDGINQAMYDRVAHQLWFREQMPLDYDQRTYTPGDNMTAGGERDMLYFDLPEA